MFDSEIKNKTILQHTIHSFEAYRMYEVKDQKVLIVNVEQIGIPKEMTVLEFKDWFYINREYIEVYDNYTDALKSWVNDISNDIDNLGLFPDGEYNFYLTEDELIYLGFSDNLEEQRKENEKGLEL